MTRPAPSLHAPIAASAVLTAAAAVAGLHRWPRPEWAQDSPWLVADVPAALWVLSAGATVAGAVVGALTVRGALRTAGRIAAAVWLVVVLAAAAALTWNALYAAALSDVGTGAVIPVFHWLFTLAPAVLAGWGAPRADAGVRRALAVGTGVVTVPLSALGWALLAGPAPSGLPGVLWTTVLLGAAPLAAGAVLVARRDGGPLPSAG
ncbi:hypothetical protein [Geodermatophilus sp. SYSU D01119]